MRPRWTLSGNRHRLVMDDGNKFNNLRCAWLLTLLLLSGLSIADVDVYFARDPWPPFFTTSNGLYLNGGAGYEVTKEIFSRIEGLHPVFPVIPWKRALMDVRHGNKDAISFLIKNPQREDFLVYSLPVATASGRLFYTSDRFPEGFSWSTADDLKALRIGVVSGYSYGQFLDELVRDKRINYVEIKTSNLGFAMLARGRIDLMAESAPVGVAIIEEQGWTQRAGWAEKSINADVYYIAFSKKSPLKQHLQTINDAILEATKDGSIDAILEPVGAAGYPHEDIKRQEH